MMDSGCFVVIVSCLNQRFILKKNRLHTFVRSVGMIDYCKTSEILFQAWIKYKNSLPPGPVSLTSFAAGFNAATTDDHSTVRPIDLLYPGRNEAIKAEKCIAPPIGCGGEATVFEDLISEKEYQISGLCQKCQDEVFNDR
jgi:hypothetical protein